MSYDVNFIIGRLDSPREQINGLTGLFGGAPELDSRIVLEQAAMDGVAEILDRISEQIGEIQGDLKEAVKKEMKGSS